MNRSPRQIDPPVFWIRPPGRRLVKILLKNIKPSAASVCLTGQKGIKPGAERKRCMMMQNRKTFRWAGLGLALCLMVQAAAVSTSAAE